jgi:hypothetical protein
MCSCLGGGVAAAAALGLVPCNFHKCVVVVPTNQREKGNGGTTDGTRQTCMHICVVLGGGSGRRGGGGGGGGSVRTCVLSAAWQMSHLQHEDEQLLSGAGFIEVEQAGCCRCRLHCAPLHVPPPPPRSHCQPPFISAIRLQCRCLIPGHKGGDTASSSVLLYPLCRTNATPAPLICASINV